MKETELGIGRSRVVLGGYQDPIRGLSLLPLVVIEVRNAYLEYIRMEGEIFDEVFELFFFLAIAEIERIDKVDIAGRQVFRLQRCSRSSSTI
jgi:hypothetical protein